MNKSLKDLEVGDQFKITECSHWSKNELFANVVLLVVEICDNGTYLTCRVPEEHIYKVIHARPDGRLSLSTQDSRTKIQIVSNASETSTNIKSKYHF